jgi:hypothetical protein
VLRQAGPAGAFKQQGTVSLCMQGKHTAAHALLADVYGWFTEGFETAALQEARGLLEGRA